MGKAMGNGGQCWKNSRNIIETSWRMLDVEKIGKKWKILKHIGTCWKCWKIYEIHSIKMNIFENIDEWKPWGAIRFHQLNMGKYIGSHKKYKCKGSESNNRNEHVENVETTR